MHAWQCLGRGLLPTGLPRPAQKGGHLTPFRAEKQRLQGLRCSPEKPVLPTHLGDARTPVPTAAPRLSMLLSPAPVTVTRKEGQCYDEQSDMIKVETEPACSPHARALCSHTG